MKDSFLPLGLPGSGEVNNQRQTVKKRGIPEGVPGMRYDFLVEDALKKTQV
jgi:hypothetical protein